jgi:hypothetical protein
MELLGIERKTNMNIRSHEIKNAESIKIRIQHFSIQLRKFIACQYNSNPRKQFSNGPPWLFHLP